MKVSKYVYSAIIVLIIGSAILITGCKKDSSTTAGAATSQQLSMYLTDDPSRYDSVYIDIKYIEVKTDSDEKHRDDDHFGDKDDDKDDDHKNKDEFGKWDTLNIKAGIYNIAKLRNGVDLLMGTANVKGAIRKIRITLGTSNSLLLSGVSYQLNLLAGVNNYLYVKINKEHHHEFEPGKTALWIDFDISRSIIYKNGNYYLKPQLKPFCDKNFARIKGKVYPEAARSILSVYNSSDTAIAIPENDGTYKVRGLKEGAYKILFKGFNGYRDTTLQNIQIKNGDENIIQTITLVK